jgi:outer membrane cobalamin receptor
MGLLPLLTAFLVVGDTTGMSRDTLRFQLDQVVVTATRSPLRLAEAPAATTVLSRDGGEVIPGRTLAEALERADEWLAANPTHLV